MSRPGTVFTWSTNTNYSAGPAVGTPTKTAPSGADIAEGYEPAQEPGAQGFNYNLNLVGQWITWLAAGILDGTWEFSGASVKIDGTLEVVGAMTFDSDVTLAVNKSVIVSGTGKHKRGTRTRKIVPINGKLSGSAAAISAGSPLYLDGRVQMTADGDLLACGLVLNDDEQLTGVTADIFGDTSMTVSMKVLKTSVASGAAQLGSTSTSSAASSAQLLSSGALTESIVAGESTGGQHLYVVSFHGTTNAAVKVVIGSIEYTTTVP